MTEPTTEARLQDQVRAQELQIMQLRVALAESQRRCAQKDAHIERQARRLAIAQRKIPTAKSKAEKVFSNGR